MTQTLNGLPLSDNGNLVWTDEMDWTPMAQAVNRSASGALDVQLQALTKGRPITLTGDWISRANLDALAATITATDPMALVLASRTLSVIWDHAGKPIEASPLNPQTAIWDDQAALYELTLRFIEV